MQLYRLLQCSVSLFYLHQPEFIDLIIPLLAAFFHTLQLRPYSFPAIRLNLFIFPGQIADYWFYII